MRRTRKLRANIVNRWELKGAGVKKGVIWENLSGKKVELRKGSMKQKGDKRDLRVIKNSKVAGVKGDHRREKELMGIDELVMNMRE